jgi:hypothetical protein
MGSDTAFSVVILDTLSNNLDITSLQVLGASHPWRMNVSGTTEKTVINFSFPGIKLLSKNQDLLKSQGYISFALKLKSTLLPGTITKNTASIYFDFNKPVKTNEVVNTIFVETITNEEKTENTSDWSVYPNPASKSIIISGKNSKVLGQLEIFNIYGRKVFDRNQYKLGTSVPVEFLRPGYYIIQFDGRSKPFLKTE